MRVHDLGGALLTPGLIDAHTHLVYGGDRAPKFELRLQGASYEQIARAGGGIRATVAATRAADDATLLALALPRARALMAEGVTTLEIKSGYGLALDHEARCLAWRGASAPRAARPCAPPRWPHTRCRRSTTAGPTTTSTPPDRLAARAARARA
jgi:imidazolonepropionase